MILKNPGTGSKENFSLLLVTSVLVLGFFTLLHNREELFDDAQSTVVLKKGLNAGDLADALIINDYISDEKDAGLIAEHIINKLSTGKELPNLGELNKRTFRIPADLAYSKGGAGLKQRVIRSREILGIDEEMKAKYGENLPAKLDLQTGNCDIVVKVQQIDSAANRIKKWLDKDYKPADAVPVRLKEHYYTFAGKDTSVVAGYAMTDKNGVVVFKNLNKEGFYSVLPIEEGYEYGNSKGTTTGSLSKNREFTFTRREHQITPFDASTFSRIKEENTLTVRTPNEYKYALIMHFAFFLLAWWGLHFFLAFRNRKRKINTDNLLLPVMMTLSGICLLTMYSIINRLNDRMLGDGMVYSVIVGVVLMGVVSEINFVNFHENYFKIKFDFIRQFFSWLLMPVTRKHHLKLPDGLGYAIAALGLMVLLFIFGRGPEGSGAKVNLFGFQPGEFSKYLIVFFISAFFCKNAGKIQAFSGELNKTSFRLQLRTVLIALFAIVLIFGIYLGVLNDGGPALVITCTFILIYSVARRDLWQLFFGMISFIVFLMSAGWLFNHTMLVLGIFAGLWLAAWIAFWYFKEKKLYESAIFMNLLIALFVFGGSICDWIGLSDEGKRLNDRNSVTVWSRNDPNNKDNGIWDNEAKGGDQVANGIWALASGGFSGQGLGKGNPTLIPAFHTDMVFTSIGEELGLAALVLIILCMAILLHRSLLLARRAGNPFAFFLITGIAVVTGVQFLVIVLGSIGLIPLTGVTVPFLSYGGSSMSINLAAFGIVLSLSRERATKNQAKEINKYDNVIVAGAAAYIFISLILLCTLLNYMVISRAGYLIKYAAVTNIQGVKIPEYNPRINLLMKKLYAGNIYDRNGLLLASNEKELLKDKTVDYVRAGIDENVLNNEFKKKKIRYYPFGNRLFFMLGDINTKIQWSSSDDNPYGYMAESRCLSALRGFDNLKREANGNIVSFYLAAKNFRPSPFLKPRKADSIQFTDYDYSALLPMLKAGVDSREVAEWNKRRDQERNITLTIDAALQTKMQNEIEKYANEYFPVQNWKKLRISVVVLNAQNGDLLCSANYPLPDRDILKNAPNVYSEKDSAQKAYTDRDLGLTLQTAPGSTAKVMSALAGFQKLGTAAAEKTYNVDFYEIVDASRDRQGNVISAKEPYNQRGGAKLKQAEGNFGKTGEITMKDAIVLSSNNYFINFVNDNNLYLQLDSIYQTAGIRIDKESIDKKGRTVVEKTLTPYFFDYPAARRNDFKKEISSMEDKGITIYTNYITKRDEGLKNSEITDKNTLFSQMNWTECAWAWGQGTMRATPLNMARVVSIVTNGGTFVETKFIKAGNKYMKTDSCKPVTIVSREAANILKEYMQNETSKHRNRASNFPQNMGGKTGTPERDLIYSRSITDKRGKTIVVNTPVKPSPNDGWYIFFVWSEKENAYLAAAVRIERLTRGGTSDRAVDISDKVVINKVLRELEYVK